MQIYPEPTKSPLLLTPPPHNRQSTRPRSSASNSSRNSAFSRPLPTFSGPSPVNNNRFHQQHCISRPDTTRYNTYPTFSGPANHRYHPQPLLPRPSHQHQNFFTRPYPQHQQAQEHFFTRPYQQPQGHCTQQVFHVHITLPYPPQYCTT